MSAEVLRALAGALIAATRAESAALLGGAALNDLDALAEAKALAEFDLAAHTADLGRDDPRWVARLHEVERVDLGTQMADLAEAARANGVVLQRRIVASEKMLHAIGEELRRAAGTAPSLYGASGASRSPGPARSLTIDRRA